MPKYFFVASLMLLCAAVVTAQEVPPGNSTGPSPSYRQGMPPCLRAAGVSMLEFDQLRDTFLPQKADSLVHTS